MGGDNYEASKTIAVDLQGNAYIAGNTSSANFPVTAGAFQTTKTGSECGMVSKLNPTGTSLVYSTFLGGKYYTECKAIDVDILGNAFMTGMTNCPDFPVTNGAFQTLFHGYAEVFITKINNIGTSLIYSTYIGGSNYDTPYSLVIDASGNAYISGETTSTDYPTAQGSYQTFNRGNNDAFITKLNSAGNTLVYSSYLGGANNDHSRGLAIDNSYNSYVMGYTGSASFPITPGAFQTTMNGGQEVFLTKLDMALLPLKVTVPNGGEIWKGGDVKSIKWEAVGVSNIKIQYSTDKGASWNTISENYPTVSGSFSWTVPMISSPQTLIKISDVLNSSTGDTSNSSFVIWQVVTSTLNTFQGWNNLFFGQMNLMIDLFATNPKPITVTYYEYEAPLPSALPTRVFGVSGYYWKFISSDSIVFNNGYIRVLVTKLRNPGPFFVWLKRNSPNDAWTNIGGTIMDGYFVNTTLFSSFSEFAVGFYNSLTAVELSNFTAHAINDKINLSWTTSTETNNRGFEIQRKSSTYDYRTVAFINGNGTTTQTHNYSWSEKLPPGVYSYQLKQVDYNGNFEYSKEVDVLVAPISFYLEQNYPNPFNPSTTIKYNIPDESNIIIRIYNSLGQNVGDFNQGIKPQGFHELQFNSTGLASGVYLYAIKAISVDGKKDFHAVKKMIIMK